jgi:predicted alpha/beta-hydrolase family hydrolase
VVERLGGGEQMVIGGKSLGGRIASMIADDIGARGLVCLGYPFHPSGKPDVLRVAHLRELRTPTLIVQGTRDALGRRDEVEGYDLSPNLSLIWLEDGDHSFKPRVRSGRTERQNMDQAIEAVAGFVKGR